jgi:geranylgeranyl diphosphate synthase type II
MRKSSLYSPEFCDRVCRLALEGATHSSGILGATGGQFLDLYPPTLNLENVKQVIYKKTVTLFEISFLFGWLFGGGDLSLLEKVKKTAYHFGMAFQIADDLDDMTQDEKKQRDISMARLLGRDQAFSFFEQEMLSFEGLLKELELYTPSFQKLSDMLYQHAAVHSGSVT